MESCPGLGDMLKTREMSDPVVNLEDPNSYFCGVSNHVNYDFI